ncbi:hematopoietic prostaglandin D synthase-like [Montipora capricornis]|uniref:hematopoietic prostaglandin D synthase-like n=1 Tax=Montipora capricornis TaxID=246305 RepID=UPI0035F1B85A
MASRYKLTYFDLKGRAEAIRIAFEYAGVKYEDVRISWENRATGEWSQTKNSGKFPFGTLPILEVDGVTLSQSMAILRFVAKRHGLSPEDEIQLAKADAFAEEVYALENGFIRTLLNPNPEENKDLMDKFFSETVPMSAQYLEKILEKNEKCEVYCVGNKLSYADIYFFTFFNNYSAKDDRTIPDALKNFPRLTALYEKVRDEPKISEWIERRPKSAI